MCQRSSLPIPLILLLTVGLLESATAASEPAEGELRLLAGARFAGELTLEDATLFVPAESTRLEWREGRADLVERSWRRVLITEGAGSRTTWPYALANGTLERSVCLGEGCRTLIDLALSSPLLVDGASIAIDAWIFHAGSTDVGDTGADHRVVQLPGDVSLPAGLILQARSANLLAVNTGAVIGQPDGRLELLAATTHESLRDPLTGTTIVSTTNATHLRATFEQVNLETSAPTAATVDLRLARLEGTLLLEQAEGWVRIGQNRHEVVHAPVVMDGTFSLSLRPDGVLSFHGDATYVFLRDAPLVADEGPMFPAAAMALLGALLVALRYLPTFYTRLDPRRVLEHPVRARLHAAIGEAPGIGLSALATHLNLGRGTVRYQLRILQWAGYVRRETGPGRDYYYERRHPEETADQRAVTEVPTRARLLHLLEMKEREGETLSPRELAEAIGAKRRVVSYHLLCLLRLGLIRREGYPHRYRRAARERK